MKSSGALPVACHVQSGGNDQQNSGFVLGGSSEVGVERSQHWDKIHAQHCRQTLGQVPVPEEFGTQVKYGTLCNTACLKELQCQNFV